MPRKSIPIPNPVIERIRYIESERPLQDLFDEKFKLLPEFDFYATSPDGEPPIGLAIEILSFGKKQIEEDEEELSHYEQYRKMLYDYKSLGRPTELLFSIKRKFMSVRDDAKQMEWLSNFKEAAYSYEWLIAQKYPLPYAYDRLIKIYKDHNLINDAIEVGAEGILFFTELRTRQANYVGELAEKYGCLDYFLDRVIDKKKVFYYGGSFELYNPFPIIEKWKGKIEKLCNQRNP